MRRIGVTVGLLVTLLLVVPMPTFAQGVGLFHTAPTGARQNCTDITSPVAGRTLCWDQAARALRYYDGTTYLGVTAGIVAVTGDTLQTLINQLPSGGGTVVIPNGVTLDVSTAVTYPTGTGGVEIVGMGWNSRIRWTGGNSANVLFMPSSPATSGHALRNLQIVQSGAQAGIVGIQLGTALLNPTGVLTQVAIERVLFNFNGATASTCIRADGEVDEVLVLGNWCFGPGAQGLLARRNTAGGGSSNSNWTVIGNHFQGLVNWGIDSDVTDRWTIIGNTFQATDNAARGIGLDRVSAVTISSNYFELQGAATGPGIHLGMSVYAGGTPGNVSGAIISGNHLQVGTAGAPVQIDVDFSDGASLTGNYLIGTGTGIRMTANSTRTHLGINSFGTALTTRISGGIGTATTPSFYQSATDSVTNHIVAQENTANSAQYQLLNPAADQLRLRIYGSTAAGTTVGIANANLAEILADPPNALLIRTIQAQPLVFSTQNVEVGRIGPNGGYLFGAATGGARELGSLNIASDTLVNNKIVRNASGTVVNVDYVFADLNLVLTANGMQVHCTDCNIVNPCTGGGLGALAKRLNGIFVCN